MYLYFYSHWRRAYGLAKQHSQKEILGI